VDAASHSLPSCFSFSAVRLTIPRRKFVCERGLGGLFNVMSEQGNKCPMGKHPWVATFFVIAFVLVFIAHKLGLL
jgi:hypothetical protein